MKQSNMYRLSVKQWNPFVGCEHNCSYCKPSFQRQLKRWAKGKCQDCYDFKPHFHKERLDQYLPRTGYMQLIFTCANGDVAFCKTKDLQAIVETMRMWQAKGRTFLLQSKNPSTFKRVIFPRNVILGTTIETNIDNLALNISNAPVPSYRLKYFKQIQHQPKMLTIEPVLDFHLDVMIDWVEQIKPCMVWLGYDSKNTKMKEPALRKFAKLHWELSCRGFVVILKTVRKAWWQ